MVERGVLRQQELWEECLIVPPASVLIVSNTRFMMSAKASFLTLLQTLVCNNDLA